MKSRLPLAGRKLEDQHGNPFPTAPPRAAGVKALSHKNLQ
jgi:hypothetical protein